MAQQAPIACSSGVSEGAYKCLPFSDLEVEPLLSGELSNVTSVIDVSSEGWFAAERDTAKRSVDLTNLQTDRVSVAAFAGSHVA